MPGKLIVLEGIDKAGKTTILSRLVQRIESENAFGLEVCRLQFPVRESQTGRIINKYLESALDLPPQVIHLLFSANRWEMCNFIKSSKQNKLILCDRYYYSGIAYTHAKGVDIEWCRGPDSGLPVPDIVFFLDVGPESAATRPGFSAEKYENVEFLGRVYEAYRKVFEGASHCISIENEGDIESTVDTIYKKILAIL